MTEIIHILIGVGFAFLCLIPARNKSLKGIANIAYLYLAVMVMIYIGAYLVTGDMTRLIYETIGVAIVSGVAIYFKNNWPYGMALLIFCHGFYDMFLGHSSGVMDWYPAVCAGFDLTAGLGFFILMRHAKKRL